MEVVGRGIRAFFEHGKWDSAPFLSMGRMGRGASITSLGVGPVLSMGVPKRAFIQVGAWGRPF